MAPFQLEGFLGATLDNSEEAVSKQLSLIHLGAELLEIEKTLRKGRIQREEPKRESSTDRVSHNSNDNKSRWMFWK